MPNQDEYFGNLALKGFQEISAPETMLTRTFH